MRAIALAFILAAAAGLCSAQSLVHFEDAMEASNLPPTPALKPVHPPKKHGWFHLPSDRTIWVLGNLVDVAQFSYSEVDTLETARIRSGKGMREARLSGKMLTGLVQAASLIPTKKKK